MQKQKLQPVEILGLYQKPVRESFISQLKTPVFPEEFAIPDRFKSEEQFHWEMVRDYPMRQSKYLRPTLILLVAESMEKNIEMALPTAVAMQASEEWILIHDDFEDNSLLRRGLPALHRKYPFELAVNAGDYLHITMWEFLRQNISLLGTETADKVYKEFFTMLSRTALGQTVEIRWTLDNKMDLDDEDWFFVCDGKTGYYTIAGPMRLGAIISGATQTQLEAITKFGILLGRCFQLVDDTLDLTGDFSGKKQPMNDLYEGKRTLILGHLLRSVNPEEREKIKSILMKSRNEKTESDISFLYDSVVKYGSIEYAKKMAVDLRDKALVMLDTDLAFLSHEPARSYLRELTNFIVDRKY